MKFLNFKLKINLPIIFIITPFLLFKFFNLSVRLSDSNIYFYTGYQLLQGKILYKDIFFTNFPLLPYMSSLYFLLFFGSLKLFFLTPAIEASIVAALIYFIAQRQTKSILLSTLSSMLYLYSFIVLVTSDHQSGVFLASLFAVISYYFFFQRKHFLAGIFIALAFLTKAYFIPIFAAYFVTLFLERSEKSFSSPHERTKRIERARTIMQFVGGFIATIVLILLPTLLFAYHAFIKDVFILGASNPLPSHTSSILSSCQHR